MGRDRWTDLLEKDRMLQMLRSGWTLAILAVVVFGAGITTVAVRMNANPAASDASSSATPDDGGSAANMMPSKPTRVRIPAIAVDSSLDELGLEADGTMEVPPYERSHIAGWYKYGPTPGEIGPSVIVGHVDTREGGAVFFRLRTLTPGDVVHVDRADGSTATFTVRSVTRHPKDAFPTDEVYGDISHAGLRLITCAGRFDARTGEYEDNVIVYADLAS